eukprot:5969723-Prymnesium_polylepis.1
MSRASRRRVDCACTALRLRPLAGPMRVSPPAGTHVSTPELCGAQLGHLARSDYNSMDDWGECHAG